MSSRKNPTLKSSRIKIAITIGDPSGIGPAITLKALGKLKGIADFIVIGDKFVLEKASAGKTKFLSAKLLDLNNVAPKNFAFGKIRAEYGRASIEYLDKALELIRTKKADALVTCPISKEAIKLAGFSYTGHTEYLAKKTHTRNFVMFLFNRSLKIALLTRHLALKDVSGNLSRQKIYRDILLTYNSLKKLFLLKNPRIAVCGLNPHASDNGTIGTEENKIIKPALEKLSKHGIAIDGPLSADVAIYKANIKEYDCAVAMYHDQALIPLKLSGFDTGVNMTLGLPFLRTSVLHGTAFDIAGNLKEANPNSLIEAVRLAVKCTANLKKA